MTYQIFKLDKRGVLIMERITQSQAVRNIAKNQILNDGFSCVIMKYYGNEFYGKEVYNG